MFGSTISMLDLSCILFRRWTSNEHRVFLEGIMLYGKDWKKVQSLLKTRSIVQIRTHAQKVFKKCSLKKKTNTFIPDSKATTAEVY